MWRWLSEAAVESPLTRKLPGLESAAPPLSRAQHDSKGETARRYGRPAHASPEGPNVHHVPSAVYEDRSRIRCRGRLCAVRRSYIRPPPRFRRFHDHRQISLAFLIQMRSRIFLKKFREPGHMTKRRSQMMRYRIRKGS